MWVMAAIVAGLAALGRRFRQRARVEVTDARGGDPGHADAASGRGVGPGVVAVVLLAAALAVAYAQAVVVTVLPVFAARLHVDVVAVTWLLTAFMLASGVATPLAGRLGDLFGYRPVLVACAGLLVVGSVLGAVATAGGWFPGVVAGRVLQGLSGGVFPLTFGMARRHIPENRLPGVVAALSAMFGVGGAVGTVCAGPILDAFGIEWLFWPVAAVGVAVVVGIHAVPEPRPAAGASSVDIVGAALLSGTLVALLLGLSQGRGWGWGSPPTVAVLAAAACGAGFVARERGTAAPLIDLRLLAGRDLGVLNIATLAVGAGMFAAVTLLPRFAQTPTSAGYGFGASASSVGFLMVPMALGMVVAAPMSRRLAGRFGGPTVFGGGAVLGALSLAGFAVLHAHAWQIAVVGAVLGVAYGLVFASLGNLLIAAVPPADTGAATGLNTVLRTVGGAAGAQLVAVVVGADRVPAESRYTLAFAVSAFVVLLAAGAGSGRRSR